MSVGHDDLLKGLPHRIEGGRDRFYMSGGAYASIDQRRQLAGEQPGVIAGPREGSGISGIEVHQSR